MRQRHQHGGKEDPVPRVGSYAAIEAYPYCTWQCATLVQLTSIRIHGHCKLEEGCLSLRPQQAPAKFKAALSGSSGAYTSGTRAW